MRFSILSLFPAYFESPFRESMVGRAVKRGLIEIESVDVRDFAEGIHRKADDRPYGGGPGMVMKAEPLVKAIRSVRQSSKVHGGIKGKGSHVVHLSPQGKPLTAKVCRRLAGEEHLVLVCGHYEGVDERVLELEVDEEISIGDYVLTSGCAAAIVMVDATVRFVPGVLGHDEAAQCDSFEGEGFDHPHYTRPESFEGQVVPEVLLSGHHEEIKLWRKNKAREKTERVRPEFMIKEKEENGCLN